MSDSWGLNEGDEIAPDLTALKKLGGGAAYEAFLAFDAVTHSPVVTKVVRPAQVDSSSTLRGLRREVEMLTSIAHPAIVRMFRAELEGPRPHVVLEQIDGPRLSSLIRRYGALDPQQFLPLGIEIASALHYMHRCSVVHLDVKPSNIIMGAPAKLIDLSVARSTERAAALTAVIGTDAYLAPEQADPARFGPPGPASDVWGLGATLFEAVAGHRPFPRPGKDEDPQPQKTHPPYRFGEHIPFQLSELVLSCLEFRPADRPTPAEVADALGPMLEATPRGRLAGFKSGARI